MERSEPTLVPEWLKNGSLTGGNSISHSDDNTASRLARNKSFVHSNGHDVRRSSSSEITTSSYFRRRSSSKSSGNVRSYSSFCRKQHGRDWEKDTYDSCVKDNTFFGDRRHWDFPDPMGNTFSIEVQRDGLRRSQSMISEKHGDTWTRKVGTDSSSAKNNNGLRAKGNPGGVNTVTFDKDFPSLGAEERTVTPDVGRVRSPGLSPAIHNLPVGTSAAIVGERWTSALAEVPLLAESNGTAMSSVQQVAPSSSKPMALGTTTSLNMAEAVVQGPSRAQTPPQLSVGPQRLEELAIKQSRQLIPVMPSLPKTLVSVYSDKQKAKVGPQPPITPSLPINHSHRGGVAKSDVSKTSNTGKLRVLKPVREKNGATVAVKANSSPTSVSKVVNSTYPVSPSVSASPKGPPNNAAPDRKPTLTLLEKRPTSQARSRNDFFNLVRKKAMENSSSVGDSATASSSTVPETGSAILPSFSDKPSDMDVPAAPNTQCVDAAFSVSPVGNHVSMERGEITCNGDACNAQKYVGNGKKQPGSDPNIPEEEAAFLRSLGWQENDEEDGLTEEEIMAFYRDVAKYTKSKPTLGIQQSVQPKLFLPLDSQNGDIGGD